MYSTEFLIPIPILLFRSPLKTKKKRGRPSASNKAENNKSEMNTNVEKIMINEPTTDLASKLGRPKKRKLTGNDLENSNNE